MPDTEGPGVDPGLRAFVDDPRLAVRPPPPHVPIAKFRAAANGFLASGTGPAVADICDLTVDPDAPTAIRLYRPSDALLPVIVFIHGGGFIFGNLDTHDALCRRLAIASGVAVAAIDYRLAPKVSFPTPLDDCLAALSWLLDHAGTLNLDAGRLALCGDSAGGQLATATALTLAERRIALRYLGLFYPLVDPACGSPSALALGEGYMLTRAFLRWSWQSYRSAPEDGDNPLFDLMKADPVRLPPTTVVTAEYDPLRDEGEALAAHLSQAGVAVTLRRYPRMIHGFAGLPTLTATAEEAIGDMATDLAAALAN